MFHEIAERYPHVQRDFRHVDVAAMMLARNPQSFDVIVTPDLYGDILSGVVIGIWGA